jgi:hypothetical protein
VFAISVPPFVICFLGCDVEIVGIGSLFVFGEWWVLGFFDVAIWLLGVAGGCGLLPLVVVWMGVLVRAELLCDFWSIPPYI